LGDSQNTVRDLVDDSGDLIQHTAYSSFGQMDPIESSNPVQPGGNPVDVVFGYTGTFTDPATGEQLHGIRWYDPADQRWQTPDPSGLSAGPNPYEYCGDAPTDGTDPSGLAGQGIDKRGYAKTWEITDGSTRLGAVKVTYASGSSGDDGFRFQFEGVRGRERCAGWVQHVQDVTGDKWHYDNAAYDTPTRSGAESQPWQNPQPVNPPTVRISKNWKAASGSYNVDGAFLEFTTDGFVRIRKADGHVVRIRFDKLSATDQKELVPSVANPRTFNLTDGSTVFGAVTELIPLAQPPYLTVRINEWKFDPTNSPTVNYRNVSISEFSEADRTTGIVARRWRENPWYPVPGARPTPGWDVNPQPGIDFTDIPSGGGTFVTQLVDVGTRKVLFQFYWVADDLAHLTMAGKITAWSPRKTPIVALARFRQ
jgi:RHS repeat-associated protein